MNDGPQAAAPEGFTVKLIFAGLLTDVLRFTAVETGGAHLKESPRLPELPTPALPENCIVTGLVENRAFGLLLDAIPTAM